MPRGRPRKIIVEHVESDSLQWDVAKILSGWCNVPGCGPKFHLENASTIINMIEARNKSRSV
jgi:hypothetical protein